MHTIIRHMFTKSALVVFLVIALCAGGAGGWAAQAANLPATICTGAGTVTCELWATTGTITLPGAVVIPVWGYTGTLGGPAEVPGPALIVNQGDTVNVILHNNLAEPTALLFDGQAMPPDLLGVAAGGTATYTFVASKPGTFLYEAGLLANAQHQVALGMYGALVVHSAVAGTAYGDPGTTFTDEALVVLGEVDPVLNNSVDPATFDMRNYAPKYFLINGQSYPNTVEINATAGVDSVLLLRYIDAGIDYHSMALLGLDQTLIANDANPLAFQRKVTAETIGPGQTYDVLVNIPATVAAGSKYALYDGNLMFHNGIQPGYGGMLVFLTVGAPPPPGPDVTGPATSGMGLSPNPTDGTVAVALSATVSDATTGGANVTAAEYFIDTTGAAGTGTVMSGAFGSPTVAVNATISAATLAGLASGNHTFYVRGQDAVGNWGPFNYIVLNLDKVGPTSDGLTLTPNPSNGTANVALHATGDDRMTGGGTVIAAEYFIGAAGAPGTGTAMTVTPANPVASLDVVIPAANVIALAEGSYVVSVDSQDTLLHWGPFGTINLIVDKTGPSTSAVTVNPSPNNGTQGINSYDKIVRVTAQVADPVSGGVNSNIVKVEGFIDTVGVNGTGFWFTANDGVYDSLGEPGFADIPLSTIAQLSTGVHTFYVHGLDAAGNWGATSTATLIVDKVGPAISALLATPNPTNAANSNNTSFTLSATATDPVIPGYGTGLNVVAAEWWEGVDPGVGLGNAMTGAFGTPSVNVSATVNFVALGWLPGNHTVYIRAKDASGNWGTRAQVVVNVVMPNNIFANGFDAGNFAAWSAAFNVAPNSAAVGIFPLAAAAQSGGFGMQARINGNTPGFVTDNTPLVDPSYHARFYFNPRGTTSGNAQQAMTIFAGQNAAGTNIFQVQYRRLTNGGGTYQVRLWVLRAGGNSVTGWYNINNNAWNAIEIAWQSGTTAQNSLYINGTLRQIMTLNTSAYKLDAVRLGPSAGLVAGAAGVMYFDSFMSTRNTVIGMGPPFLAAPPVKVPPKVFVARRNQ
jgi:FtsP/CotA-like multicopper oxidase with cupredoxin domain